MKSTLYVFSTLMVLIIGCLSACKSFQPSQTELKEMPDSYARVKDSTNAADITWRTYFADPSLIGLLDTALQHNLDLLSTLQRINIAQAELRESNGALLPQVSGSLSAARRKFGLYTMDGAGNATTPIDGDKLVPVHLPDYFVGLTSSWEVDVWGKLRNKKKAALARYLSSIEGKNWLVSNLVSEVSTAYYQLIGLDTELDIIRETISLQEQALTIVSIQKQAGAANQLAVEQFGAQLLRTKALEKGVLQQIGETENRINLLLGRYPQPISRNKALLNDTLFTQVPLGIPSQLLVNRPDIKQAQLELKASGADMFAAKAAFYPSFTITGVGGFQAFDLSFLFVSPQSFAYSILAGLSAPLINRNAIKAAFKAARARQLEALYTYQKSILNGYVEVYNEMMRINTLRQILDLKQAEVATLTRSINTSTELYRTGKATYLEVLFSQQNALQSRLDLVEAKKQQYVAQVSIYKALGGGWK